MVGPESRVAQFAAALELDQPAREAMLDALEATDPVEARQLRAMLAQHEGAARSGFLDPPRAGDDQHIGAYRLLEVLGEGGMGVVYRAEQTEPVQRQVALKVIHPALGAASSVVARFEAERQTLALMDHEHVARIHDAGATEDGRPYFAMELVEGESIVACCDRLRLDLDARLGLFRAVCAAVQHAHQKGVIHRDLKPSNILVRVVDGAAVPKIIDFGIARAVDAEHACELTLAGQVLGTPETMSPEQAEGAADVDTRTDVYALGAVLYRLLVGTSPLDRDALRSGHVSEVLRAVREVEPPRPSVRFARLDVEERRAIAAARSTTADAMQRALASDLDWIVMRALEKRAVDRYPTAAELGAEIGRHLAHEPIVAHPPTWRYPRLEVRPSPPRPGDRRLGGGGRTAGGGGGRVGARARTDTRPQARRPRGGACARGRHRAGEHVLGA